MIPIALPSLGQPFTEQGGVYLGPMRSEIGQPDWHLIVADARTDAVWGGYGKDELGAKHARDGLANTRALVASSEDHPAAQWAAGLNLHGFSDWYMPSQAELMLGFINAREVFGDVWHWSSTQCSRHNAWSQPFVDGGVLNGGKGNLGRVRAFRRFIP